MSTFLLDFWNTERDRDNSWFEIENIEKDPEIVAFNKEMEEFEKLLKETEGKYSTNTFVTLIITAHELHTDIKTM